MKSKIFFALAAIFALALFASTAHAVCLCEGGPTSASCKACGSGSSDAPASYSVKGGGQTLADIASECGVDVDTIKQANNLGDNSILYAGQNLQIPGGKCTGTSAASGASSPNPAVASASGVSWPTPCCAKWYSYFGVPRVGHSHQGIDIGHSTGTPIFAIGKARAVNVVSTNSGTCGKQVSYTLLDGSGWYVLNCHMDAVSVRSGQIIEKCQQIGTVGKTGNAASTPAHNHFEIHPRGRGTPAVNPLPLLQKENQYCK